MWPYIAHWLMIKRSAVRVLQMYGRIACHSAGGSHNSYPRPLSSHSIRSTRWFGRIRTDDLLPAGYVLRGKAHDRNSICPACVMPSMCQSARQSAKVQRLSDRKIRLMGPLQSETTYVLHAYAYTKVWLRICICQSVAKDMHMPKCG
jgi:hypothetical protein